MGHHFLRDLLGTGVRCIGSNMESGPRRRIPSELDVYSFVTRSELQRFASELAIGPRSSFADLGCGRGGPGLWVAAQTGARLIGVDIAEAAVAAARTRSQALGLDRAAEFRVGTFEATGLPDASLDAAMSVDAFLFSPDKDAATRELARVLKPGARLAMTTWDYHTQPVGRPPQVADHRPLLRSAGFEVIGYDETDAWKQRIGDISRQLLESVHELARESGSEPAKIRRGLEEMKSTEDCMIRRVFIVAERN